MAPDGPRAATAATATSPRAISSEQRSLSGIAGCKIANFETSHADSRIAQALLRARKLSRLYVDSFYDPTANRFRETGLIYTGPPGVGKTHLASAVLAELIGKYRLRGRFVDFTTLIHRIQSSFDPTSPESKHQILDPVIDAEILVIDELGAQKPREWVMDLLYVIMNTRYTRRLPTLFTSNYSLEERPEARATQLSTRISPLLVSRLYEMAQPIEFANWDYRRQVKVHQHRIDR